MLLVISWSLLVWLGINVMSKRPIFVMLVKFFCGAISHCQFYIKWMRTMIIKLHSNLQNTKGCIAHVCDKLITRADHKHMKWKRFYYLWNGALHLILKVQKTVQKKEILKVWRSCLQHFKSLTFRNFKTQSTDSW